MFQEFMYFCVSFALLERGTAASTLVTYVDRFRIGFTSIRTNANIAVTLAFFDAISSA